MEFIDLFDPLFLFIEMSLNKSSNHKAWIKDDKYNCKYYILDIFVSFFIVKVTKLLVNTEISTTIAQKNKERLIEIAIKI